MLEQNVSIRTFVDLTYISDKNVVSKIETIIAIDKNDKKAFLKKLVFLKYFFINKQNPPYIISVHL